MTMELPRDLSGAAESAESGMVASSLSSLCSLLWQERVSLEVILFKLVEEQLIAAQGHTRFLQLADEELREAAGILRENEILRSAEAQMVARLLGLPSDASLGDIAARSEEPWPGLLLEHRDALRGLLAEIESVAQANRKILLAGAEAARAALEQVSATVATYDARGSRIVSGNGISLVDRQA
jgi:hypothetical protein